MKAGIRLRGTRPEIRQQQGRLPTSRRPLDRAPSAQRLHSRQRVVAAVQAPRIGHLQALVRLCANHNHDALAYCEGRLLLRHGFQARRRSPSALMLGTSSDSAAFARASTTAPAAEGRAGGIARASVVGVELRMHPDVGVCSIGYDELIAVLCSASNAGTPRRACGMEKGSRPGGGLPRPAGDASFSSLAEERPVGVSLLETPLIAAVWPPTSWLPLVAQPSSLKRQLYRRSRKFVDPRSRDRTEVPERISAVDAWTGRELSRPILTQIASIRKT